MGLILAKLVLTPLVILAASLASRRWGDAVGGWLVGLPLISGPVSAFLTIERGPEFAAAASAGSIAGVASQAFFCMGYAALARRGWAAAFLGGGLSYLASAVCWNFLQPPLPALMAIAGALLMLARALLPHSGPARLSLPAPSWDIPARMAIVTIVVMGVTLLATALGPRTSGMTASFPWIGGAIAVFAHRARGPAAAVAALRGMASALYGFIAFFAVIGFWIQDLQPLVGFAAATAAALGVQAISLRWIRNDARRAAMPAADARP